MKKIIFVLIIFATTLKITYAQCYDDSGNLIDPSMYMYYPGCSGVDPGPGFPGNPNPINLQEVTIVGYTTSPVQAPYGYYWWNGNIFPLGPVTPMVITNPTAQQKPCPGDIIKNPTLAPSGGWNFKGGTYGKTRNNNTKMHDGLDIRALPGTPVHFSHSGKVVRVTNTVSPGKYIIDSYGNFVEIEFKIGADTYRLLYGHLDHVSPNIKVGMDVAAGNFMGQSGQTGNAGYKEGETKTDVIPHVHIRARKNGVSTDPAPLISSKFNTQTGAQSVKPCNN